MAGSVILGFFDGIHIAHRKLISNAVNFCANEKCILITFKQSPAEYFNHKTEYIMSRKNSVEIIKSLGVNEVRELDFPKIADMTAEEYIEFIVKEYSPSAIFSGYNHTFGRNKKGTPNLLKQYAEKYSYEYFCMYEQTLNGEVISSSHIKELISQGNIEHANTLLGSSFNLSGTVIKGSQIGRTIGFPTANFEYPNNIVELPYGVYRVNANIDGKIMPAIMNWGQKPTLNNSSEPMLEVHILNFEEDLYGKNLRVEILKKLRGEMKFNSIKELKSQIEKDIKCLK